MTRDEYIASLTMDELRAVARFFWDWWNVGGCPKLRDSAFLCCEEAEFKKQGEDFDIDACPNDSGEGCEIEYAVWLFRNNKEMAKENEK